MDNKKLEVVKTRTGFIAALDQSGGSSAKTLEKYGIKKDEYQTEEEMFDLIHQMRTRVITSDVFNDNHILGTILFYKTMMGKIEGEYSADYLWNKKNIVSFCFFQSVFKIECWRMFAWPFNYSYPFVTNTIDYYNCPIR